MRSVLIIFIALISFSFSCNDGETNSETAGTAVSAEIPTQEENEKLYKEAEERARESIEKGMATKSFKLVEGSWSKVNSLPCTDSFPNSLNLMSDGSFSTDDQNVAGLEWSSGSFNLKNQDEITFSDGSNKSNTYQFRHFAKMAMITIHLTGECTLVYKKNL